MKPIDVSASPTDHPEIDQSSGSQRSVSSLAAEIEKRVDQHPEKTALQTPDRDYSYAQINQAANRIAHALHQRELAPGAPVGIALNEPFHQCVALLGIWKAGLAFFSADPTAPDAYNRNILQIVQPPLVLTDSRSQDRVQNWKITDSSVLTIEDLLAAPSCDNLNLTIAPETLARIVFTSGSTGQPKGVMHVQAGMISDIKSSSRATELDGNTCLLQVSPLSHLNGSDWVAYTFFVGATLSVYPLKERGVAAMGEWIAAKKVTRYTSVPTVFRQFCKSPLLRREQLQSVETVYLGGELIRPDDWRTVRRWFPASTRLLCNIGSTEAGSIAHIFYDSKHPPPSDHIPLGLPYPIIDLSIQGSEHQPVPAGKVGEIIIQSPGLARGYFKDPERTAQAFHFEPGEACPRYFRSGDLGRIDSAGRVIFEGRRDQQVKINGHRIELGEIEAALESHPNVGLAAVRTWPDTARGLKLAAYFTALEGQSLSTPAAFGWLRERLPAFMIPRSITPLETMPFTSSGKLDRAALPLPSTDIPPTTSDNASSSTEFRILEISIGRLMAIALDLETVSPDDDFFQLGGDSLQAIELAENLERAIGGVVPPSIFISAPTPRALARNLHHGHPSGVNVIPLNDTVGKPPLFFVHGWLGDLFPFVQLARRLSPHLSVFGIQNYAHNQVETKSFETLVPIYTDHVQRQQPEGPYRIGGFSLGGLFAFAIAAELRRRGATVEFVLIVDSEPHVLPWRYHVRMQIDEMIRTLPGHLSDRNQWKPSQLRRRLHQIAYLVGLTRIRPPVDPHQQGNQAIFHDQFFLLGQEARLDPCLLPVSLITTNETPGPLISIWKYLSRRKPKIYHLPTEHLKAMNPEHTNTLVEAIFTGIPSAENK
jgi:amino acid adenylation domain-containing protein